MISVPPPILRTVSYPQVLGRHLCGEHHPNHCVSVFSSVITKNLTCGSLGGEILTFLKAGSSTLSMRYFIIVYPRSPRNIKCFTKGLVCRQLTFLSLRQDFLFLGLTMSFLCTQVWPQTHSPASASWVLHLSRHHCNCLTLNAYL